MKNIYFLIIIFCIILVPIPMHAESAYPWYELFLVSDDQSNPNGTTIFTMEAETQVWDTNFLEGYGNSTYSLTEDYQSMNIAVTNDNVESRDGFHFVTARGGGDEFGYGKYSLSVTGGDYIRLDYRDDRAGYYDNIGSPIGQQIDVWIKYVRDSGKFYYNSFSGAPSDKWVLISGSSGTTVNIWEIKGMGSPSTGMFEPYPPENLTVYEITPDEDYALYWNHHSPADDYWQQYYVYRSITSIYPPDYVFIDSTSNTNYLDDELTVGTGQTVYYKVKTKNSTVLSEFSNEAPEYTGPTGSPQTPSNFHVTWVTCPGGWNPKLEWNLITGDPRIRGYKLHRSLDGSIGPYSIRASIGSNTSYFIDTQILKSSTNKNADYVHYKIQSYTYEQEPGAGPLFSGFAGPLVCRYDEDGGFMPKQIADGGEVVIPNNYVLHQNFPNPFNPTTSLIYEIPRNASVSLRIIDTEGREVKSLVNNSQQAGIYVLSWNGTDANGEVVSSGLYMAHMQAGDYSHVIKMIYLR